MPDVATITGREALDRLAYVFGRIGRCIASGGRRMERMALQERMKLKRPDKEGRQSPKGEHKQIIQAMASITQEELRKIRKRKISNGKHQKSSRAERRAALRDAGRSARAQAHQGTHQKCNLCRKYLRLQSRQLG